MDPWFQALLTMTASVLASSGFWAYFTRKDDQKSASTKLLMGLAHDRIIFLGMDYIHRGWLTQDEYDAFVKYLYKPYVETGGNGLAQKIMEEVKSLPFKKPEHKEQHEG